MVPWRRRLGPSHPSPEGYQPGQKPAPGEAGGREAAPCSEQAWSRIAWGTKRGEMGGE